MSKTVQSSSSVRVSYWLDNNGDTSRPLLVPVTMGGVVLELDVLGLLRECPLEVGIDNAEYISLDAAVDLAPPLPDDTTRSE